MAKDKNAMLMGLVVGALLIGGFMYISNNGFLGSQTFSTTGTGGGSVSVGGTTVDVVAVKDSNVKISAIETYTGAVPNVNAELVYLDGKRSVGETNIATTAASLTTAGPMDFDGYVMIGNDNFESSTDRGAEVYYRKIPESWTKNPNNDLGTYYLKNESSSVTWTGKDDGTVETTTNITVNSGVTVYTASLRLDASATGAIGNPDFANPTALCFNATTYASFDAIKPSNYVSTFSTPGFLSTRNIIGGVCYVLPIAAVEDGRNSGDIGITIDPAAGFNPGDAESAYAFLLDKTWYKNDKNIWEEGWGDNSDLVADTDIGLSTFGSEKLIAMN